VNEDPVSLSVPARPVDIHADDGHTAERLRQAPPHGLHSRRRVEAAQSVDAIGYHEDFPAHLALGPSLQQTNERQVRAVGRARTAEGQPQRLGDLGMVVGEILQNVDRSISHVTESDKSGSRLRLDESTQIV
jgi:hypothetical protein